MSRQSNKPGKRASMANIRDRHELYEASVQNVAETCSFVDYTFQTLRQRKARSFREDFCGTASACCEWVKLRKSNSAVGVDCDSEVLAWSRKHRMSRLKRKQRKRLALLESDVRSSSAAPMDAVGAFNFSYWIFKEREALLEYFRSVVDSLEPDGLFFLDAYGGTGAFSPTREKLRFDDFTYVWEQARLDSVSGRMLTHIHFHFADGSKMKRAFSYDWRVWSLPEIRELLEEAGFIDVLIYREIMDDEGNGLGEWLPIEEIEEDDIWIVNLVAIK